MRYAFKIFIIRNLSILVSIMEGWKLIKSLVILALMFLTVGLILSYGIWQIHLEETVLDAWIQ
jgi:hypothetical protein